MQRSVLSGVVYVAVTAALVLTGLDWLGWVTGQEALIQFIPASLDMAPWTALLALVLGIAVVLQSGRPERLLNWAGVGLAAIVGVCAALELAGFITGTGSVGDLWPAWSYPAIGAPAHVQPSGQPSPASAVALLCMSFAVGSVRIQQRWVGVVSSLCLATALAIPIALAWSNVRQTVPKADQGIVSLTALLMLFGAMAAARPTRFPVAWLLEGHQRLTPVRLLCGLALLPIFIASLRWVLTATGMGKQAERVVPIMVGLVVFAGIAFLFERRENGLQAEMERIESRYRLLAENAVDIVVRLRGTQVVWISPSVQDRFGWPVEKCLGADFRDGLHPEDQGRMQSGLEQADHAAATGIRARVKSADGGYHWIEARGKPYIDTGGNSDGLIVAARIVDAQVEAEQQLDSQRRRFEAVVANTPSAISVCDLDLRYTLVNRSFCELFGQNAIADVIGRTKDEILPPETLESSRHAVSRLLAGETFQTDESIAVGSDNIVLVTHQFPLRNAAGEITELVTMRTDITHRKHAEQVTADRAMWEERITSAAADGRLLVYSQPIVEVHSRATVEEELLVRLRDSQTGKILLPGEFLPQCERHGLMPTIDQYMVGQAIELAHQGRHVCVNITGQTIGNTAAMAQIQRDLTNAGKQTAEKILFEVTESTALGSPEIARTFSQNMSSLGCRIALDDFGTGYGTFTELRNLKLNSLKIDQSFVRNLLTDQDDQRAVQAITLVARTYNLTTIAEGVETEQTLNKLADLEVNLAQGYLFGKPSPIN